MDAGWTRTDGRVSRAGRWRRADHRRADGPLDGARAGLCVSMSRWRKLSLIMAVPPVFERRHGTSQRNTQCSLRMMTKSPMGAWPLRSASRRRFSDVCASFNARIPRRRSTMRCHRRPPGQINGPLAPERSMLPRDISGGTAQLHQQLIFRPVPGLARSATPITNLYLASSSAHPGVSVHGASGANAARAAVFGRQLRTAQRIGTAGSSGVAALGVARAWRRR